MKFKRIIAQNYKTYKDLDLDLNVTDDRPIVLVGGANGCGKTTLFDAIYHALYGLTIKNAQQFEELFNAGEKVAGGMKDKQIALQIEFSGMVLNREMDYKLRRAYKMAGERILESVTLSMGGNTYAYGSGSTAAQRSTNEEAVNKIIAANLPAELSNYFLFDAMKTSELVKEEQINRLIEKNINSVMGFNKYSQMRRVAEKLLDEKKGERLENENMRQEYQRLTTERQQKEEQLKKVTDEYAEALCYANDHRDEYEQMLKGRNQDDLTRDKMNQLSMAIDNYNRSEKEYWQDMENLTKDFEVGVVYPKIADVLRIEVEKIVHEKEQVATAKEKLWTEEQLTALVERVMDIIKREHPSTADMKVETVVDELREENDQEEHDDAYAYLNAVDVEVLEKLVNNAYTNNFIALDERRERILLEQAEMPRRREQYEEYRRVANGHDYTLIQYYEENNQKMETCQETIKRLKEEIAKLEKEISKYDYDLPQEPDPQYDLLCKLPEFFKNLSQKLIRAKKASIERMMRDELNVNLVVYAGCIGKVELSAEGSDDIVFKIYHKQGNEIYLNQLNAGAKQTVMQVLLKVLHTLGDYEPPVMIDTVMGVLDKESRAVIIEHYFPDLARQTILLSTDTEITAEQDYGKIRAFVAKAYTLHRDKEAQCTHVSNDYFGLTY